MKKMLLQGLLALALTTGSPLCAGALKDVAKNTEELYTEQPGEGSKESAYTAIAVSMVGWGIGLAAGITLLVLLLESSTSTSH